MKIFYTRSAHHSNHELLNCHFFHMLCWQGALEHKHHMFDSTHMQHWSTNITCSIPHTCNLVWVQWASAGIRISTYTSICICFLLKIWSVVIVIVALKCNEKSLGIESFHKNHGACCKIKLVLIDRIMRSQQKLYDRAWYFCSVFWWFKDVISVGKINVCQHKTKLALCVNISLKYIGLHSWKVCAFGVYCTYRICVVFIFQLSHCYIL